MVLFVIVEWLLFDLWIIGVDLLVIVDLLMEVMFLMILLFDGIVLLVEIFIMLLRFSCDEGIDLMLFVVVCWLVIVLDWILCSVVV